MDGAARAPDNGFARSREPREKGPETTGESRGGLAALDIEKLLRGTPAFASRFELKESLGEGGMGAVFRARDTYRDREVAIKVALHETAVAEDTDARMRKLWINETRLAGKLRHPYVVELLEAGDAGTFGYLAMEVVDGGSLKSHVRADRLLPVERVIDAIFKVARALEYANTLGLLHRDIKPANVLLTREGQPKVSDFGSVFVTGSENTQVLDVGTLPFVPPEQLAGGAPNLQADIYATGVMAYQLLTGALPFSTESQAKMIYHKLHEEPIPIDSRRADLMPELRFAVNRAIHRDPKVRYGSWSALCEDLARLMPELNAHQEVIPESELYGQVKGLRFFDRFGETELWEAARLGKAHRAAAGEVVFREGSPGASVHVLLSGRLEVARKGVRLGFIEAGDCFGELAFVEAPHHIRSATVTAATGAVFLEFGVEAVAWASAELQAALSGAIMRVLVARLHHADARYLNQALKVKA